MLCGTREDVAAGAMAFHAGAGLQLPLLQPVLQEDRQIDELIAAAAIFASIPATAAATGAEPRTAVAAGGDGGGDGGGASSVDRPQLDDPQPRRRPDARRGRPARAAAPERLYEILRPFAFTASIIPVLAGASLAWVHQLWDWPPSSPACSGGVLLHAGTNVVNEVYDVRKGIDTITSPRASHAIVKGRISERAALLFAGGAFALAVVVGVYLDLAARAGDRGARASSGCSAAGAIRRRRSSTRTAPSASRSCSCSWARSWSRVRTSR